MLCSSSQTSEPRQDLYVDYVAPDIISGISQQMLACRCRLTITFLTFSNESSVNYAAPAHLGISVHRWLIDINGTGENTIAVVS